MYVLAPPEGAVAALAREIASSPFSHRVTKSRHSLDTGCYSADFPSNSTLDVSLFFDDLGRARLLPLPPSAMDRVGDDAESGAATHLSWNADVAALAASLVALEVDSRTGVAVDNPAPSAHQVMPKGLAKKAKKAAASAAAIHDAVPQESNNNKLTASCKLIPLMFSLPATRVQGPSRPKGAVNTWKALSEAAMQSDSALMSTLSQSFVTIATVSLPHSRHSNRSDCPIRRMVPPSARVVEFDIASSSDSCRTLTDVGTVLAACCSPSPLRPVLICLRGVHEAIEYGGSSQQMLVQAVLLLVASAVRFVADSIDTAMYSDWRVIIAVPPTPTGSTRDRLVTHFANVALLSCGVVNLVSSAPASNVGASLREELALQLSSPTRRRQLLTCALPKIAAEATIEEADQLRDDADADVEQDDVLEATLGIKQAMWHFVATSASGDQHTAAGATAARIVALHNEVINAAVDADTAPEKRGLILVIVDTAATAVEVNERVAEIYTVQPVQLRLLLPAMASASDNERSVESGDADDDSEGVPLVVVATVAQLVQCSPLAELEVLHVVVTPRVGLFDALFATALAHDGPPRPIHLILSPGQEAGERLSLFSSKRLPPRPVTAHDVESSAEILLTLMAITAPNGRVFGPSVSVGDATLQDLDSTPLYALNLNFLSGIRVDDTQQRNVEKLSSLLVKAHVSQEALPALVRVGRDDRESTVAGVYEVYEHLRAAGCIRPDGAASATAAAAAGVAVFRLTAIGRVAAKAVSDAVSPGARDHLQSRVWRGVKQPSPSDDGAVGARLRTAGYCALTASRLVLYGAALGVLSDEVVALARRFTWQSELLAALGADFVSVLQDLSTSESSVVCKDTCLPSLLPETPLAVAVGPARQSRDAHGRYAEAVRISTAACVAHTAEMGLIGRVVGGIDRDTVVADADEEEEAIDHSAVRRLRPLRLLALAAAAPFLHLYRTDTGGSGCGDDGEPRDDPDSFRRFAAEPVTTHIMALLLAAVKPKWIAAVATGSATYAPHFSRSEMTLTCADGARRALASATSVAPGADRNNKRSIESTLTHCRGYLAPAPLSAGLGKMSEQTRRVVFDAFADEEALDREAERLRRQAEEAERHASSVAQDMQTLAAHRQRLQTALHAVHDEAAARGRRHHGGATGENEKRPPGSRYIPVRRAQAKNAFCSMTLHPDQSSAANSSEHFVLPHVVSDPLIAATLALRVCSTNSAIALEQQRQAHFADAQRIASLNAATQLHFNVLPSDVLRNDVFESFLLDVIAPAQSEHQPRIVQQRTSWVDALLPTLLLSDDNQYDKWTQQQGSMKLLGQCRDSQRQGHFATELAAKRAREEGAVGTVSERPSAFYGDVPSESDPMLKIIDGTVERIARKSGDAEREAEIAKLIAKAGKNPMMAFLDRTHKFHAYFRHLLGSR